MSIKRDLGALATTDVATLIKQINQHGGGVSLSVDEHKARGESVREFLKRYDADNAPEEMLTEMERRDTVVVVCAMVPKWQHMFKAIHFDLAMALTNALNSMAMHRPRVQ